MTSLSKGKIPPLLPNRRTQNEYGRETSFVYGDQSFGRIYKNPGSEDSIHGVWGNTAKKIRESLEVLKIDKAELSRMSVLDIGTGRQAIRFQQLGARKVTHFDISRAHILQTQRYCEENGISNITSIHGDLTKDKLPEKEFDLIFASGIYQHIQPPHLGLVNFAQSLKVGGRMYMGFYRSGDWRWFITALIREALPRRNFAKIKAKVALYFALGDPEHFQVLRMLDDFYVPAISLCHPRDIQADMEACGFEKYYLEDDFREYCHDSSSHLSIGADRIYVVKKKSLPYDALLSQDYRTARSIDQLRDIDYRDELILENIDRWLELVDLYQHGFIDEDFWLDVLINLYRFARPWNEAQDFYFLQAREKGRHILLAEFLRRIRSSIHA